MGLVCRRLVEGLDGILECGSGKGAEHLVPEIGVPIHLQRGFVGADGDKEFPERRVFGIDAEIVVVGLDPCADEMERLVEGGGFVELRAPGDDGECDEEQCAGGEGKEADGAWAFVGSSG